MSFDGPLRVCSISALFWLPLHTYSMPIYPRHLLLDVQVQRSYTIQSILTTLTTLSPLGETLASAGDDGNVILWVPSESAPNNFGSDDLGDKESWRAKHMCRSSGAEIYDLAWSPDAVHFIIGSMDNIARIYNANTGQSTISPE